MILTYNYIYDTTWILLSNNKIVFLNLNQVAEAVYEYGKGNYKKALELLGPDFDAADYKYKVICSCISNIYDNSNQYLLKETEEIILSFGIK